MVAMQQPLCSGTRFAWLAGGDGGGVIGAQVVEVEMGEEEEEEFHRVSLPSNT